MMSYVEKTYALLSAEGRRRWIRSIPLILATSASEAVGAAGVFALVASVADPQAVGAIPIVGEALRNFGGSDPKRVGVLLVVAITAFYVLKSGIVMLTEYAQASASARTASDLSVRLLTLYLRAPYLFHLQRNSTDLVHATTQLAGTSFGLIVSAMVHSAAEVLVLLSILCVLLLVAPGVTMFATAVLSALGGLMLLAMRRYSVRLGQLARDLGAMSMRHQTQALSAVDEITVLDRADHFINQYEDLAKRLAGVLARESFSRALPRVITETLFICGALSVTVALLLAGVSNTRTISLLGLFAYAGFRIIPSTNRILLHVQTIRHGQAAIDHILADIEDIENLAAPIVSADDAMWRFAERIELRGVTLEYGDAAAVVLDDVDLSIPCGKTIAIVGATGSGKSSLVRLLVGLLPPTRGEVTVDGVPLAERLRWWRRQLGYVPQEVHLVDDTLRRNVAFGLSDSEIDAAAVVESLQRAQLDGFVDSLAEGLDTRVGERGVRLSGGERQRVGIARALYHRPAVLILDEATSALDPQTESAILGALRADLNESTLIAVTHRLHAVREFDRVVFLERGRLRGVGSYDELFSSLPEFRSLAAEKPTQMKLRGRR